MSTAHAAPPRYGKAMTGLPDWTRPPSEEGWFAEDLDRLHGAPAHTESPTHSKPRHRRT
ncbi:hypothetical protein ACFFSW_10880 [Saccharothrix longispora]|uniref:Uncharacterized protein n=1 Tax=Saccharothrix longispora TaxID=33920 RepID=A0ABU1Q5K5_9PSEU|nr:hypothetical protein [Saccharothrix longispora]MDR6598159.1 hypothetical protein [Saccharothrix longispora]